MVHHEIGPEHGKLVPVPIQQMPDGDSRMAVIRCYCPGAGTGCQKSKLEYEMFADDEIPPYCCRSPQTKSTGRSGDW